MNNNNLYYLKKKRIKRMFRLFKPKKKSLYKYLLNYILYVL